MTISIAITGKSGNGKTTVTKALLYNLRTFYPDKTFLVVDNDLSSEFGHTYGQDVRQTVYGIRSGKHEYKTGVPSQMTRQEYIEWAMEDIICQLEDNVDLLVTWLVPSKDCRCPVTYQINEALSKLFNRYDFVLFDCEYDLKYLTQLVDCHIDSTIIVSDVSEISIELAGRIQESSEKYAIGGQLGVLINKVQGSIPEYISQKIKEFDLNVLGTLPYDEQVVISGKRRESAVLNEAIKEMFFRLNLPFKN